MALFAPLLRKRRIVAAKTETTVGTPISLAAADATYNCFDSEIQNNSDNDDREGQSAFSRLPSVAGQQIGVAKFKTELIGGTPTAPAWMTTLLPACGVYGAALIYSPTTNPPGSGNVKTVTIGMYEDGLFKSIAGAMGNAVFTFTAGKRIMIDWTFTGVWQPPSDVALIAPTYSTVTPIRFVSSSLLWGSWTPRVGEMSFDLGNDVQMREDGASAGGLLSAVIVGRKPMVKMDPESTLLASGAGQGDVYGRWLAGTEAAMSWSCTSGSTTVAFSCPKAQLMKVTEADRNKIQIDQAEFQLNRGAAAGDDEFTITSS